MGILYFDVEANYEELIELRKQIAGLEKQMTEVGSQGAAALEPLEKKYAALSSRIETLTSQAATKGQAIQSAFSQMEKVSSGISATTQKTTANAGKVGRVMADGVTEADNAAQIFNETLGGVNRGLGKTLNMMNGLGSTIGTVFGVGAIGAFINKVQEVRTYFQDIESSMRVFLGDAEKADKFTSELKSYAYYNMFEFADLAGGAKQLIAYGNETEKIIPIMDKLSNVATGTGASLGELISLYNKAKSTGQVMARDVQSWAAKGVVLRDELKAMGVEASTGAVTFNQLNQVLERVTGEGGRFHNLMAEQMNNLSAAKGQFKDNLDAMYNEIGEKLQPLLKGSIDMASWLVDNYEAVGKTVLELASAYGIYRTVLGVMNSLDEIRLKRLQSSLAAINGEVVATKDTIKSKGEEILARKENIATMEKEIAMKQATLKANRTKYLDEIELIRLDLKEQKDIKKELTDEYNQLLGRANGAKTKTSRNQIEGQMAANRQKMADAVKQESALKEKLKDADDALIANSKQLKAATEAMNEEMQKSITLTDMLANAKTALSAKVAPLKAVLSNPYVILAAAIAACLVGVYKLAQAQITYGSKAYEREKEELEAYNKALDHRIERSQNYINTIKDENKSLAEQEKAYKRLITLIPSLKDKTFYEVRDMSTEELNNKVDDARIEKGERLKKVIEETTAKVKELEEQYEKGETFVTVTGAVINTAAVVGRELDRAKARLKAYQEEYEEFSETLREAEFKRMTHEQRNEILTQERDQAQERLKVMNDLYANFAKIRDKAAEDENVNREELQKEYLSYVQKQIEKAEGPLKTELEGLLKKLQGKLFDNPLQFAFGDLDLSRVGWKDIKEIMTEQSGKTYADSVKKSTLRDIKSDVNDMNKEINRVMKDNSLADSEKANQINQLYTAYISKIEEYGANEDNLAQSAIEKYADSLRDIRDTQMDMFNKGGVNGLILGGSEEASKLLRQAEQALNNENKGYSNYQTRLKAATDDYNEARTKFKEFYDKMMSGESIKEEDFKTVKENFDVAQKSYDELLKEGQRYDAYFSASRKRRTQLLREAQDRDFSIREKEISLMRDGADKSIAQVRLEFEKRQEEIKRGYEDIKETRLLKAKEAWESNPDNVKKAFTESAFLANYETNYAKEIENDIALKTAQDEANVMDYIRELANISKSYQTEAEKKADERRKREEDILAIDKTIEQIRNSMTDATHKEGEEAIRNLEERKKLAEQIRDALGFNQSRNDYYIQYGSAFQRRQATNEKYDNLIANEQDEWKRRSLENQRESDLMKIAIESIKKDIDWAGAMGDLGRDFADYARQVYDKAIEYSQTAEFRAKPAEEQQAYMQMLEEVKKNMGYSLSDLNFVALGKSMNAFKTKTDEAIKAISARNNAEKYLESLQQALGVKNEEELENRLKTLETQRDFIQAQVENGTAIEGATVFLENLNQQIRTTKGDLSKLSGAFRNLENATEDAENKQNEADNAGADVKLQLDNAVSAINAFGTSIQSLKSISSLTDIGNVAGNVLQQLGSKWGGLVGAIVSVVDMLGETFLGEDWLDFNTTRKNFEKMADATNRYLDALDLSIELLEKRAAEQNGLDARETRQDIIKRRQTQAEELRKTAIGSLNIDLNDGLFGGFFKTAFNGKDTYNRRAMKNLGYEGLDALSLFLGRGTKKSYDELDTQVMLKNLFNLSADELENFMIENEKVFAGLPEKIQNDLKALLGYLQDAEEQAKKVREEFLHITFDDMYSSFVSKMKDMKTTAYDTSNDIGEMFFNAFMDNSFDKKYKEKLQALYDEMGDSDRELTDDEIREYQVRYQKIVEEGLAERDRIAKITGYNQSYAANQASSRGFQAMSQEAGNELNGRFTNLQISGEMIRADVETQNNELLPALSAKVESLMGLIGGSETNPISNIISQIQKTLNDSYLELQNINSNTGTIMEFWNKRGELRAMLEAIKRNTDKIKS